MYQALNLTSHLDMGHMQNPMTHRGRVCRMKRMLFPVGRWESLPDKPKQLFPGPLRNPALNHPCHPAEDFASSHAEKINLLIFPTPVLIFVSFPPVQSQLSTCSLGLVPSFFLLVVALLSFPCISFSSSQLRSFH